MPKKQKLLNKVSEPRIKKKTKVKPNVCVSLPINHFINAQNKRCKLVNNSVLMEKKQHVAELKVPRLVIKMMSSAEITDITKRLRETRRNKNNVSTTKQNKNTDESNKTISKKQILQDLSVVINKELKDISNNLKSSLERSANMGIDQTTQCSESPVCIHVNSPNEIESHRTCHTIGQGLSNTKASKDTLREPMYVITRAEFEKYEKLRKNPILQESGVLDDQSFNNCKRTEVLPVEREIIDLNHKMDTVKLNQERLNLALNHSEANKTIIRALQNKMTNSTNDDIIEVSRPTRASTPFPFVVPNFANITRQHSSGATMLSNSQSMIPKRLEHNNQQVKDITIISPRACDRHAELRNEVNEMYQGNNLLNEVNLNTLAETASSLNKLSLPPKVAALKQDYQLRQNQLAQRQREKALEIQSHKHMMHPSQLLPLKSQPHQTLPAQFQSPKSQPPKSNPNILQMQPPHSQPAHKQRPKMHLQQPQPQQVQSYYSQSTQLRQSMSQTSVIKNQSQSMQTLQTKRTQQLHLHCLQPTQPTLLSESQPTQLNTPLLQLPLQQPPSLPPSQLQPSQMQLFQRPSYPQPKQMPHSQWPSFYGSQQWQQNFYYTPQQQNGQYIQRQHNYPNAYETQNQKMNAKRSPEMKAESWDSSSCREGIKPGKNILRPEHHRPITLLSKVSKVFKKLLLQHLTPHIPATGRTLHHATTRPSPPPCSSFAQ
ncbi:hypothetical protein MSG28_010425 [Choristoneura fumiferana]|uniref:Uncharacterized protein n=1 Tax=Choristoneura fumiferana TaxID=7141 RepID=A0ACC0KKT7_CHOFU|nr:hypothetical protein MSG28_010425 [Choristoneura fumiferana]